MPVKMKKGLVVSLTHRELVAADAMWDHLRFISFHRPGNFTPF